MKYILASASPRRREILANLGLDFTVLTSEADETCSLSDAPSLAEALAKRKGQAVADMLSACGHFDDDTVIISADTVVECEGCILGKPRDRQDAIRMMLMLSGKAHRVVTGFALTDQNGAASGYAVTEVVFSPMTEEEILWYVDSGECYDKAGGYGIQGSASLFIEGIRGCYFNVVGLPVNALNTLHRERYGTSLI